MTDTARPNGPDPNGPDDAQAAVNNHREDLRTDNIPCGILGMKTYLMHAVSQHGGVEHAQLTGEDCSL